MPPAQHAIVPSWLGTQDCRCASPRYAAAHARSSTRAGPIAGPPPVPRSPVPEATRSPRAPQTTGTAPITASTMVQISSVACRPLPGTSVSLPDTTRRRRSLLPRSTHPPQWPPRTVVGSRAEPPPVGQATAATQDVVPDPTAVAHSSQPPQPWCCDDLLNPSSAWLSVGTPIQLPRPKSDFRASQLPLCTPRCFRSGFVAQRLD